MLEGGHLFTEPS